MSEKSRPQGSETVIIERADLAQMFDALRERSYQLIGPTLRDSAMVYDAVDNVDDLPIGWIDEQEGGTYRLQRSGDARVFGYTVGPHSWKKYLHPPMLKLWQAARKNGESGAKFEIQPTEREIPHYAFIGVRACELHAIQIQDKVFLEGAYVDQDYKARRANAFIVAVNCGRAGNTCFCVSMNSGPEVAAGFDIALTEVLTGDQHYFVAEAGSARGVDVLDAIPHRAANATEVEIAKRIVAATATQMGRTLETDGLKELLYDNLEHPNWDEIADRCLTCGNCTMVCPTCFCTTVEDVTDLTGDTAERWRKEDSCFSLDFSHIHGGSVRSSSKSRYRQWMTHKLASWEDQFDTSGCVGCGRCITWCPVGIDLTAEAQKIRDTSQTKDTIKNTVKEGA